MLNSVKLPAGFTFAAYEGCIEWSEESCALPVLDESGGWPRLNRTPKPGEQRVLYTHHPFSEKEDMHFWSLYLPALSSLNGWEEYPEEIDQSAFIECRFIKCFSASATSPWIQVEVIRCIPLSEAMSTVAFAENVSIDVDELLGVGEVHVFSFGKWCLLSRSVQSDTGCWVLINKRDAHMRLIAHGEWGMGKSYAYLTNCVIRSPVIAGLLSSNMSS